MTRRRLAGLLTLAAAVGSLVTAGPDPAVVVTDRGSVRGTAAELVRIIDGIPYAAVPVGRPGDRRHQAHPRGTRSDRRVTFWRWRPTPSA